MNDYLRTRTARRQSWFGLKLPVKTALAQPYLHPMLRSIAPRVKGLKIGRLPAPIALTEVRGRAGGADFYLVEPFRCEIAKEFYWGRGRRTEPEDAFALDLMVALSADADVFLDIGAYTGVFTVAVLAANDAGARPRSSRSSPPWWLRPAEESSIATASVHRVTVHPTGVGSPDTWMRVPTRGRGFGPALVLLLGYATSIPTPRCASPHSMRSCPRCWLRFRTEIPQTPLRDAGPDVSDAEAPRVTVKIDVEGGENDVFAHGQHIPRPLCARTFCARSSMTERNRAELMGHLGEHAATTTISSGRTGCSHGRRSDPMHICATGCSRASRPSRCAQLDTPSTERRAQPLALQSLRLLRPPQLLRLPRPLRPPQLPRPTTAGTATTSAAGDKWVESAQFRPESGNLNPLIRAGRGSVS
jgi:hypothetical protein